jgi:hypothetical protein
LPSERTLINGSQRWEGDPSLKQPRTLHSPKDWSRCLQAIRAMMNDRPAEEKEEALKMMEGSGF